MNRHYLKIEYRKKDGFACDAKFVSERIDETLADAVAALKRVHPGSFVSVITRDEYLEVLHDTGIVSTKQLRK